MCVCVCVCVCWVAQLCPLLCDPWTVAHQAPLSWDSLGKNTRVGCHAHLQGSSQPRDQTHGCWITGRVPTAEPLRKPLVLYCSKLKRKILRCSWGRLTGSPRNLICDSLSLYLCIHTCYLLFGKWSVVNLAKQKEHVFKTHMYTQSHTMIVLHG